MENGATWKSYDGTTGHEWGKDGAAGTTDDRGSVNLWEAAYDAFNTVGAPTTDLNTAGIAVVQGWANNPATNFGVTLQNYHDNANFDITFDAREATTAANRPKLIVTYCIGASDVPTITVAPASLSGFTTIPGTPSDPKPYTVSGSNLTEGIVITAPTGFAISKNQNTGYGNKITLDANAAGAVVETTIYAHLTGAEGTFNDAITHTSKGTEQKDVTVSGACAEITPIPPWTSYNDMAAPNTQTHTNATCFSLETTNGALKDIDTGALTGVTMTLTQSPQAGETGEPRVQTDRGAMPPAGTDAYQVFNTFVDLEGVIGSATINEETYFWVDVTFSGMDNDKTYTLYRQPIVMRVIKMTVYLDSPSQEWFQPPMPAHLG